MAPLNSSLPLWWESGDTLRVSRSQIQQNLPLKVQCEAEKGIVIDHMK